jgi:membrane protein implicated in regulation of membrane protease activity
MTISWNWLLIISGAILILLEVALGGFAGFDLVLIGSAFVAGGAVGLFFHGLYLGMIVAGALCALYIAAGRRWVREHFDLKGGAGVKSNADAFIGEKGLVLARIAPHQPGRVKVRQEEWRAVLDRSSSHPIEEGTEITVTGVDGVTLQVR